MVRYWPVLLLVSACVYRDSSHNDDTGTTTTTTVTTPAPPPPPPEVCDGVDNDGDGLVDEEFADTDLDGIADCLDSSCVVDLPGASTVTPLAECQPYAGTVITDPWNVNLEWSFTTGGSSVVSPVTGQLTDDNADGVIDENDIPDIAFTSYSFQQLYIVSGDGSGEICHQDGWRRDGGIIIADVDSDGVNEVVGPLTNGLIRAVDGSCTTEWTTTTTFFTFLFPVGTAADLDANGDVEIVMDREILDGATGASVATMAPSNPFCWRTPLTGDLDRDGDQEVVLGDSVFDAAGVRQWKTTASGSSCFNAIANLDTDDQAEVIFSYGTQLIAHEHDGIEIWRRTLTSQNPGPPCAGDIDGDDLVEIVAPSGTQMYAYEADGTQKWVVPISDLPGAAGCSLFDMNSDGIYEILFADEAALRVYDGPTGAVLYENTTHDSVTFFETPTVADVDNDGSAEMIVVNSPWLGSGGIDGLTVFGHAGSGWPKSGQTWGMHEFSASNQNPDGTIPQVPEAPWLKYNLCRGRPYDDYPGRANLGSAVVDVCVSSCDAAIGTVTVSYQVWNDGGLDAEGTNVSLYLVTAGVDTWYGTQTVLPLLIGDQQAAGSFDVPLADWTGEIAIVADDDGLGGLVDECYEEDNRSTFVDPLCP